MHVIVLGSAAGGGVPQWNCGCQNCEAARLGTGVKRRTQDCVAVSADERRWVLLNASPDIARQIERTPTLWPHRDAAGGPTDAKPRGPRHSPIVGVVLTNGDLDHCLGLLSLREWTPYSVYATPATLGGVFERNVMFRSLDRQHLHVIRRSLALDSVMPLLDADGHPTGLTLRAFAVLGKPPLHLEGLVEPSAAMNVGVEIMHACARLVYIPGAGSIEGLDDRLEGADCLLFDGTFWSDDEPRSFGQPARNARAMAHLPVGGPEGSLEQLARFSIRRVIYTHINNSNPMLAAGSPQRASVESRGLEIATDGLELRL